MDTKNFSSETINYLEVNDNTINIQLQTPKVNESEEEQEDSNPDWTSLPEPVIDQVYSFLCRDDQCHMSLICKRWSQNYNSPSLWRTIKFFLPEHEYSGEIYPEVRFARKFGHFFRNVEIICKRARSHLINEIYTQLKLFLEALTSNANKLHSVKFINLLRFFRHLEENEYLELIQATITFLESQTHLRSLEFRETFYRRDEGAEILNQACKSNSGSLKSVIIKGFVTDPITDEEQAQPNNMPIYLSLKEQIMNVTYLRADYSQLLEYVIQSQLDSASHLEQIGLKRNLSLLDITCEASKRMRYDGISSVAWKSLTKLCPKLKVHMTLNASSHPRSDYRFFIVENVPLQNLEFRVITPHEYRNLNLEDLLNHLQFSRCHEHLENLTIVWMPHVDDLSASLTPFLRIAQKLRTIQIFLRYPVGGIENLFKSWVENRPTSLESAHISINRVRQAEDCANIMRIADEYTPILQILGVNVILIADTL